VGCSAEEKAECMKMYDEKGNYKGKADKPCCNEEKK
jgi:hypothetical protein